jgi:nitrate reductase gamma subunit
MVQAFHTPFMVGSQDNFCVALRAKAMPTVLQPKAKLLEIVNLPVENYAKIAALIGHRLMTSRRQINYRQSAVSQAHDTIR